MDRNDDSTLDPRAVAIGRKLREARRARRLTVRQAASHLKKDHSVISRYEGGGRMPPLTDLLELAALYGCEPAWLLSEGREAVRETTVENIDQLLLDHLRKYPPKAQRALVDYLPALDALCRALAG